MSALFAKIVKQALITFDRQNLVSFNTNLNALKLMVDQITASDLRISNDLMSAENFIQPNKAPCTFVHIFENDYISMSVFILRGDYTMPLHDHPKMYGILKGLTGNLLVQSYTKISSEDKIFRNNKEQVPVRVEDPLIASCNSNSLMLTPEERNFHEITALNDVAAFFDILSPPYNSDLICGRICSFYNAINNQGPIVLQKIPAPNSYYCNSGKYDPPDFLIDYT